MSEEIRKALNEVEAKLYVIAHVIPGTLTEVEKQNIRKAWYLVYDTLNHRE